MLTTPEQAREKWCPMVRIARVEQQKITTDTNWGTQRSDDIVVASCNRDALGSPAGFVLNSCRCIADKCAMWRWAPSTTTHMERRTEARDFALPGGGKETRPVEFDVKVPDAPTQGYCGIAGRPEVA
ncbi:hypothetical protein [Geminicoccus flavidas]|uniref:hypothetical protein n=1 Tax=Geminicoccus flavidas TaxID=2506407 RepID=UPI00135A677A|nr:hypothetical protein [Geminicoccus flavidas]